MTAVFSLESGAALRDRICAELDVDPGRHEERDFEDGEHKIRPLESVRGRDVYLIQSLFSDGDMSVNDRLVRTLFFLSALGDAGAGRVTAVTPYLCYARKDRRTKPRDPLSNRYVAALFEAANIDRIVTLDVHNPAAFQNAFRIPAEHLTAAGLFADHLLELVGDSPLAVVSPDAGGVKRTEHLRRLIADRLGRPVESAYIEKFRSEGHVRGGAVVGDVDGRVAILLDDLISSGGTLARAADALRQAGASTTYAAATHGVFSAYASRTLRNSRLERIALGNTIPPDRLDDDLLADRVDLVDVAPLLADAIALLHGNLSLVELTDAAAPAAPHRR